MEERFLDEEDVVVDLEGIKKKMELENDELKKDIEDLENFLVKVLLLVVILYVFKLFYFMMRWNKLIILLKFYFLV